MKKTSLFLTILFFSAVCSGCSSLFGATEIKRTEQPIEYFHHTVQHSGETLSAISGWYSGSSSHWPTIQAHNPGLDVHRIFVGSTIRIPRGIVNHTKELPRSFILRWNGQSAPRVIPAMDGSIYDVKSIVICKHLPKSSEALHHCAELMSQSIEGKLQ